MADPSVDSAPAARLVEALLGEGELVDDGRFTLDPTAAAAKLAAYQYADRSPYLVALAEGLFRLGASSIALESRGTLVITATDVELSEPEAGLADLYTYGLGSGEQPRARALARLAVGLDMVLGSGEQLGAELRYTHASGQVLAEYRWRAAPSLREGPGSNPGLDVARSSAAPGTLTIELRDDRSQREVALDELRGAVRFSDRALLVDGERISKTPRPQLRILSDEAPGYRIRAWLEPRDRPSAVEVWVAGVCVDWLPGQGRGFRAALELDQVRRDLSRVKVIRDATLERALVTVEQLRQQALAQLDSRDQVWVREGWPPAWPPELVDRILERPIRAALVGREIAVEPLGLLALMRRHQHYVQRQFGGFESAIFGVLVLLLVGGSLYLFVAAPFIPALIGASPLLGLLALLVHLSLAPRAAYQALRLRERGVQTRARVTGTDRDLHSGRNLVVVRVEWEFTDGDGAKQMGASLLRDLQEATKWSVGTQINVYYDPADPSRSVWEADVGPRRG